MYLILFMTLVMTACVTKEKPMVTVPVQVLSLANCSATPKTIKLLKKVATDLGIAIDIDHQVITTPEAASEKKFIGSPTVRVNGVDIDPGADSVKSFGLT